MIDFDLTQNDRKILDTVRKEALVARTYARHYDEHEHEFPPDALPEAKDFPDTWSLFAGRTDQDTSMGVISLLMAMGQTWGDYSVRMRRGKGGLGNAALRAAGTPEQQAKWGELTLAMAITEPGCGSDSAGVQCTAVLDGDEWVINGEKYFTSGAGDPRCKVLITMVRSNTTADTYKQHSQILIPLEAPGVEVVGPMLVFGGDGKLVF